MFRPIRPNPLMPTFNITTQMLGGAARSLRDYGLVLRIGQPLKPAQPVVDRGLRELHAVRQLAQVELRVGGPPASHLAKCRWQQVELAVRLEPLDSRSLPQPGADRLEIGR